MKQYNFNLQYPKPLFDNEHSDLLEIAKSGLFSRYSSDYVDNLEQKLAKYYQTDYAITCTSGTAALHGCLVALDFKPGSEVITTSVADIEPTVAPFEEFSLIDESDWLLIVGCALSATLILTGSVTNASASCPAILCSSEAVKLNVYEG